jgi:hypothetical protein
MNLTKTLGEILIFAALMGFLWPIITAFFGSKGVAARFVAKLPSLKDALLRSITSTRAQIVAGYGAFFVRRVIIASSVAIVGILVILLS